MRSKESYWKANLRLICFCLVIWFIVSFVLGIFFVQSLNHIQIGGYKMGFWFAQQGSIYTFVVLIFYYARQMNKLEKDLE